jgi:hypothetical protein
LDIGRLSHQFCSAIRTGRTGAGAGGRSGLLCRYCKARIHTLRLSASVGKRFSYAYAYPDTNCHSDADAECNSDCYTNANCYPYSHTNTNPDYYTNGVADGDAKWKAETPPSSVTL